MADDIDIQAIMDGTSGKLPQWATEATLQNLVSALDEKKPGSKAKEVGKATDAFSASLTKAVPGPGKLASAAMNAASSLINFGTTMVKAALTTTGDLDTFADTIRAGGDAAASFAEMLPVLGGVIGATLRAAADAQATVLEVVSDLEKEYAGLAIAGADFGGSLEQMNTRAQSSRVNLDKLTDIVQNQGLVFAQLQGTTQKGVDAFLNLNKEVANSGMNFRMLGLRFDEVAQMTADYVEIQAKAGRRVDMDSEKEAIAVNEYIARTATLARLQGKAADQVSAELRTASLDGAVQAKLSMMSGSAADNFKAISQTLETNFGPGVRRAAEQALTLGTVLPDTAKTLAAAGVDLGQFESMIRGATEADPADLLDNIAGLEQMLGERFADPTTRQIAMLGMVSDVGEGVAESFAKMAPLIETLAEDGGVLNRYATAHENVIAAMESTDYGDAITNGLLKGGQDIEISGFTVRENVLSALVKEGSITALITQSGIMVNDMINDLIKLAFESSEGNIDITTANLTANEVLINQPVESKVVDGFMLHQPGSIGINDLIDFTDYNATMTAQGVNEPVQKQNRNITTAMNDPVIQDIVAKAKSLADANQDRVFNEGERDQFIKIFNQMAESAELQNITLKKMNKQLADGILTTMQ